MHGEADPLKNLSEDDRDSVNGETLPAELQCFAMRLASVSARTARLNRDELMFAAGREAGRAEATRELALNRPALAIDALGKPVDHLSRTQSSPQNDGPLGKTNATLVGRSTACSHGMHINSSINPKRSGPSISRWRTVAIASVAVSLGLGTSMYLRPEPAQRVIVVERSLPDVVRTEEPTQIERLESQRLGYSATDPTDQRDELRIAISQPHGASNSWQMRQRIREVGVDAALDDFVAMSPPIVFEVFHSVPETIASDENVSPSERSRLLLQQLLKEPRL